MHIHHWNCLCFVPIQLYPYFHCFSAAFDCHVSHGFALIGCLWSDQQEKTLDQVQKPLQPVYELVDFCCWDCFLYSHLYSIGANHRESEHPHLGRVHSHLPSCQKKNCKSVMCKWVNLEKNCKDYPPQFSLASENPKDLCSAAVPWEATKSWIPKWGGSKEKSETTMPNRGFI